MASSAAACSSRNEANRSQIADSTPVSARSICSRIANSRRCSRWSSRISSVMSNVPPGTLCPPAMPPEADDNAQPPNRPTAASAATGKVCPLCGRRNTTSWAAYGCTSARQLKTTTYICQVQLVRLGAEVSSMRVHVNGVSLWFEVSGPALTLDDGVVRPLPTLVAVHGGPGVDHTSARLNLEPLTGHAQVIFYDQRGHGRSDYSSAEHWNLSTWASDLRGFCDAGNRATRGARQQLRRLRGTHLRRPVPR